MKIPYKVINVGGETIRVPDLVRMFGGGGWGLIVIIVALWLLSGIYIVGPDEAGVVRTFGKLTRVQSPGLNYRLPYPFEQVDKPKVTEVKRIEIGFRTDPRGSGRTLDVPEESLMLTGSLNIVDIDLIIQYKIKDPVKYLFYVRDVPTTIRVAAEAVIRQVVGRHTIDEALTTGKGLIQTETLTSLQGILDSYECGVTVARVQLQDVLPPNEVADAFREVASAKEDRVRLINEAQGYANNLLPKTRGQGVEMVLQAEAFSIERVKRSEGEAANFLEVLKAYRSAPNVTRKRMLLETMEEVLPGLKKYILKTQTGADLINVIGAGIPTSQADKREGGR